MATRTAAARLSRPASAAAVDAAKFFAAASHSSPHSQTSLSYTSPHGSVQSPVDLRRRSSAGHCACGGGAMGSVKRVREGGKSIFGVGGVGSLGWRFYSCSTSSTCGTYGEEIRGGGVLLNTSEYTEMALHGISDATIVSRVFKREWIEPEHLMKCVLKQEDGLAWQILTKAGLDCSSVLQFVDDFMAKQSKIFGQQFFKTFQLGEKNLREVVTAVRGRKGVTGRKQEMYPAIDQVDEAVTKLKTEITSKRAFLDEIDRALLKLEMWKLSLNDIVKVSKEKLQKVESNPTILKEKHEELNEQWQHEKGLDEKNQLPQRRDL